MANELEYYLSGARYMIEASHHQEIIDTLKAVNNASVSIRLYPPNSPQITNGIERGYKQLKQYLRSHGAFSLALGEDGKQLGGAMMPDDALKSFSNLIMYRQLELLERSCLVIPPGIDRAAFNKLLELFSAKVDRIKDEGGGKSYISKLGLGRFFPETVVEADATPVDKGGKAAASAGKKELPRIPVEYINVLLGRGADADVISRVGQLMYTVDKSVVLLAGATDSILADVLKKRIFGAVPALAELFTTSSKFIPDENRNEVAVKTAALLLDRLNEPGLVLFLAHRFQDPFGDSVAHEAVRQIGLDKFDRVIGVMRRKSEQLQYTQTTESPQSLFVANALKTLLNTAKGRQFLGQEKAKNILKEGEQVRRAQRVQSSVKSLMQGNREVLRSDEFCLHLPIIAQKLKEDGRDKEVQALLGVLLEEVDNSSGSNPDRMIQSLVNIAANLIHDNHTEMVEELSAPLSNWLRSNRSGDDTCEKCCFVLQSLMNHFYSREEFERADVILAIMYRLRSGSVETSEEVRKIVATTQDNGVERQVVDKLLEAALENPGDEAKSRRLVFQGPFICELLVESLMRADNSRDRLTILDLLTRGAQPLAPVVVKKLAEPMPWYGKRNLLKLLADCGDPSHIDVAYQFLQNEDLRVQREAFICLYKISGKQRKDILLKALGDAGETMKLEIVRSLVHYGDVPVVKGLGQVLQDHMYFSDSFRDILLKEVCRALGHCKAQEAEKELKQFLELRTAKAGRRIGERVWKAAEDALAQLAENQQDEKIRQARASKLRKNAMTKVSTVAASRREDKSITGLAEESKVRELFANGDRQRARVLFGELVSKVIRLRRVVQAEQLRDWFAGVDPGAIEHVVRATDLIEEARKGAVDDKYLELWTDLLDNLTSDEFSGLYHKLVFQRFASEQSVIEKGEVQNGLYFINSGRIKLCYPANGGDVLVSTLESGSVIGADTFFGSTLWTLSAVALGPVELAVLKRESLSELMAEYPDISGKLKAFCENCGPGMEDLISAAEVERRACERITTSGEMHFTLKGQDHKGAGAALNGVLCDIGTGGLSFAMKTDTLQSVRLLLGREIRASLKTTDEAERTVVLNGVIVSIQPDRADTYDSTVHVRFTKPLDPGYLQNILKVL